MERFKKMADSRTSNVIKNSGANMVYKLAHILLQFAIRTAFINILGKEYTGVSTLFTDILNVLSLMELGMGTAMTYALYKPLSTGDTEKISALMTFYKKAYRTIGILVFTVGMLITPFLGFLVNDVPNIKEDITIIFIIYVLTSASSYFLVYKTVILRASQQSRVISLISSLVFIAEGVVEIILLIIFREFYAYLITHFVFTVLRNIILSVITDKKMKKYFVNRESKLTKEETKALFKDVFALAIYKISGVMIYSTDSIVISSFIGTAEVAIIGNFNLVINSLRTAIEQVIESTKASVGNLAATATKEKQKSIFLQMNFICFWIACFCCTCIFVLINTFIGDIWFNESYKTSIDIIIVLTANLFIAIMVYPVEAFRTANGLFIQGKYRPAIMAVMNIVLDIIFVQFWGIFGVLLATFVSRVLTQVWFDPYLVYKNVFKEKVFSYFKEYITQIIVTVGCCIITYFAADAVPDFQNKYVVFGCKMVIAFILPNVILFALYHKRDEFKALKAVGGRLVKKFKK
ncbi:MAG: hypothetical protein IKK47_06375 [Ruminococcus sp.]|nr:hypothetical protein [Ruminococcus sp.]